MFAIGKCNGDSVGYHRREKTSFGCKTYIKHFTKRQINSVQVNVNGKSTPLMKEEFECAIDRCGL